MARSYHYRVTTTAPNSTHETICHNGDRDWTADAARAWAHGPGAALPIGTTIAIDLRPASGGSYQPHRRYVVEEAGVRRTDRTPRP